MPQTLVERLASSHGRNDEAINIQLAEAIAKKKDRIAIEELISLTQHKSTSIRSDVIKVLYEVAAREPTLLLPHFQLLLGLLSHKDNRMKWGAMTTLSALSALTPETFVKHLPTIVDAMDKGSVITRDHGMTILINVSRLAAHQADGLALLFEQLEKAPVNQFPMYAEKTTEVLTPASKSTFVKILQGRTDVWEIPSKEKRLKQLLKKLA